MGKMYLGFALTVLATLLLIEAGGILLAVSGMQHNSLLPPYRLPPDYALNYHVDLDSTTGVWRPPHIRTTAIRECFEVEMTSNNYGARDTDWNFDSISTGLVLLGDSFLEGQGVSMSDNLASLLEDTLKMEVFNLATAGHFGPTQYRLGFEKFSGKMHPTAILLGLNLPNDIHDEDPSNPSFRNRYRPYLTGDYPNFKISYENKKLSRSSFKLQKSFKQRVKSLLENYSVLYRIWLFLENIGGKAAHPLFVEASAPYSIDIDQAYLDRITYNLEKLQQQSNIPLIVFTIPSKSSITESNRIQRNVLYHYFKKKLSKAGFYFIVTEDLISLTSGDFHSCDPHWSVSGTKKISEALVKRLQSIEVLEINQ